MNKFLKALPALTTIVFILAISLFVIACNPSQEQSRDLPYTIVYEAGKGGDIEGKDVQRINHGEDSEYVTAVAKKGYYFVQWSDGVLTATRCETNVQEDCFSIVAQFAKITNEVYVTYEVVGAGFINGTINQVVQYGTDAWSVTAETYDIGSGSDAIFIRWSDGVTSRTRQEKNVTKNMHIIAYYGYKVNYEAGTNGSIKGETQQSVVYAKAGTSVTAIPNKGYTFVGWSDGKTEQTRQDKLVYKPIAVTAIFEWHDADNFTYNYDYATTNCEDRHINIKRNETKNKKCIVPQREHFAFDGWFLDKDLTVRVADEEGNILVDGETLFDSPTRDLYAKWKVITDDVVHYKILMVYVTEVKGTAENIYGNEVEVNYRMTELERNACQEITKQFAKTLNDWMDGLVVYEVDSYFTTEDVEVGLFAKSIKQYDGSANQHYDDLNYFVYGDDISEIGDDKLKDYRAVITTFSLGDRDNTLFHSYTTGAQKKGTKYASVYLDACFDEYDQFDDFSHCESHPEIAFYSDYDWEKTLQTYIDEFVDICVTDQLLYKYRSTLSGSLGRYEMSRLYLMNLAPSGLLQEVEKAGGDIIDAWQKYGKTGIPYTYWTNELYSICIRAKCTEDDSYLNSNSWDLSHESGYYSEAYFEKSGKDVYRVYKFSIAAGGDTCVLTPNFIDEKYVFTRWDDGCTDKSRKITNVQTDMSLTIQCTLQTRTFNYVAGEGGYLQWFRDETLMKEAAITIKWGQQNGSPLLAVPEEGYKFIGWSDGQNIIDARGNLTCLRLDIWKKDNVYWQTNEETSFVIVALFEKIGQDK